MESVLDGLAGAYVSSIHEYQHLTHLIYLTCQVDVSNHQLTVENRQN